MADVRRSRGRHEKDEAYANDYLASTVTGALDWRVMRVRMGISGLSIRKKRDMENARVYC